MRRLGSKRMEKIVSCTLNCKDWKDIKRKNRIIRVCGITKKDLPRHGTHSIPYWCPKITDYYEKKRGKKK